MWRRGSLAGEKGVKVPSTGKSSNSSSSSRAAGFCCWVWGTASGCFWLVDCVDVEGADMARGISGLGAWSCAMGFLLVAVAT